MPAPTFNPESGSGGGNTTVDGTVGRDGVDEGWALIRANAGNAHTDTTATGSFAFIRSSATTDQWEHIGRSIFTFDTSSIPDDATIDGVVFSVYVTNNTDGLSVSPSWVVVEATPAANNALQNADYADATTTVWSNVVANSSITTGAYNDFTFNEDGKTGINKTGVTAVGLRNKNYDIDNVAPSWSSESFSRLFGRFADDGGGTPPKLVVSYIEASTFIPRQVIIT